MTELEKARQEINEVDKEMAKLFTLRMETVKKIAEYKMENGKPIFDAKREEECRAWAFKRVAV